MLLTTSITSATEAASEVISQIGQISNADPQVSAGAVSKFLKEFPDKAFNLAIKVGFCLLAFYIGSRIIKLVLKMIRRSMEHANADKGVISFVSSFIRASLYIVLVFCILGAFGVNATSVAALLGSAGVAIGLAIQGSLSNFAGGVLILLMKPFVVGDYIQEDTHNNEGTVTEIRIFYTKLKTAEGRIVILPNGALANTSLTNYSADYTRVSVIKVGVGYDTDLNKAKEILMDIMQQDDFVMKDKPIAVSIGDLGASAILINMTCSFHVSDYYAGRSRLLQNVKERLDAAGIEIPYQQVEVRMIQN